MKKIFTLVCSVLFAAQFAPVSAQDNTGTDTTDPSYNLVVYGDGQILYTIPVTGSEMIDSITFKADNGTGDFVDLGLSSGTLWAYKNVGATSETDAGNYYAWGETEDKRFKENKNSYEWTTYTMTPWTAEAGRKFNKYTLNSTTKGDGKLALEAEDDAATVAYSDESVSTPSADQYKELFDQCDYEYTTMLDAEGTQIPGWKFTSRVFWSNTIFFPTTYCYDGAMITPTNSIYWTKTLDQTETSLDQKAYSFQFDAVTEENPTTDIVLGTTKRYVGAAVRAVMNQ